MSLQNRALFLGLALTLVSSASGQSGQGRLVPAPTATQWADLAKLPDLSGTWTPYEPSQHEQTEGWKYPGKTSTNPFPWNAAALKQIDRLRADTIAGNPHLIFFGCLPLGMPSEMLVSHNAMEWLLTPGRVTLLGEGDGNRLRRIYTDGRGHPGDPDLSFYGHSTGHWEGSTLVVDTMGVLPQSIIAEGESSGLPNDGGLHVVERIHLAGGDELHDDLVITAPNVMTRPYTTTRIWYRRREANFGLQEGVCQQGEFHPGKDRLGNDVFVPAPRDASGTPTPPSEKKGQ